MIFLLSHLGISHLLSTLKNCIFIPFDVEMFRIKLSLLETGETKKLDSESKVMKNLFILNRMHFRFWLKSIHLVNCLSFWPSPMETNLKTNNHHKCCAWYNDFDFKYRKKYATCLKSQLILKFIWHFDHLLATPARMTFTTSHTWFKVNRFLFSFLIFRWATKLINIISLKNKERRRIEIMRT